MNRAACARLAEPWSEVSVVLADNAVMQAANRDYLGRNEVTDVISIGYDSLPGEDGWADAEIIVNLQRAAEVAAHSPRWGRISPHSGRGRRRPAWDVSKELALYIAHGCDHLSGGRDDTTAERKRMRRRELRWLSQARIGRLVHGSNAHRR
jgi:ssRNA-specific RNase YbeY (16S rRNA maturation enzyme)